MTSEAIADFFKYLINNAKIRNMSIII